MSKSKNEKLEEYEIERLLDNIFGEKPKGGGGRIGRWEAMRSLLRHVFSQPNYSVLLSDILYAWSAKEGLTPKKTREILDDLTKMIMPNGKPLLIIEGSGTKMVRCGFK